MEEYNYVLVDVQPGQKTNPPSTASVMSAEPFATVDLFT